MATFVIVAAYSPGPRRLALGLTGGAMTLVGGVTAVLGRRSVRLQAWVAAVAFLGSGIVGLASLGFLAGPALVLASGVFAAALLLGRWALVGALAVVVAAQAVIGTLASVGVLEGPRAVDAGFTSPTAWLRTSAIMLGVLVIFSIVVRRAVSWLERSVATAHDEMRLRAAADLRRLEAERAAQDARRLELVGRLASAVAHDFNNALLVIQMSSDLLRRPDTTDEERAEAADAIADATRDASGLTRQLLVLGRRDARRAKRLGLRRLVDAYQPTLARVLPSDVTLVIENEGDAWVDADEIQLHQVLLNLVVNARDAVGAAARITLRTREATLTEAAPATAGWSGPRAAGRYALLEVEDNGVGMTPETASRAFEPFFTTKASSGGTGLGLASVLAIAEQSGGQVELDSAPGRGTRLTVWLPAAAPGAVADEPGRASPTARPLDGVTVLLCDDEPAVLRIEARALGLAGADVIRAADGDEALAAIAAASAVDVLCTDAIMPGAPVSAVIAAFEARFPDKPVVVCSGHVEETLVQRGIAAGRYNFLPKPFRPAELVDAIAARLGGAPRG